ncbi:MAG: class I SAM-dependent RNA methyltransferase [Rhodocyclaceae bacterium]|nr:class I SAM-dependent RNA methyltransferase [Rhodocyclaceae bacterium]MBK6554928.1 class I SAM-dependent RNA methyltransferase [Rhodocyclaceae bacterium]MBK6677120.1 class I SAM-dependent RNA methyltransferase [Rhodocyclaceae bacterium]MBK9309791.1 class I SAM-dependent RNA methyltransferase [Rhodocyclaceae bacterium]MBK9955122.1 class I SAM-dependent RNA methyltransferase [Rhodocyclaceae bacterium]
MRYHYFSPCPRGLEALLVEDVTTAGATDVKQVPGGVEFAGDLACCYRVNLESHIATRVLWRLATADYHSEDDVYKLARNIDWPRRFAVERTIRIYVTAQRSPLKSLEFATLRVKDAVCDVFRDATGQRPTVNTKSPDVRIHLFLTDHRATLYLDTSGEPLWQRGHKIAKVEAPLKENLAAGILRLAGWKPGVPLLDPMCGSGTFLLEAAQMSLADPPGINREPGQFAFERLMTFKPELWREIQKSAVAARQVADTLPIWGSDVSADAVARARQNLAHAGFDDLVTMECADILARAAPAQAGVMIANPPYGERLGELDELAAFYPKLGTALKRNFAGWDCWFLSADTRLPKLIGLKPMRKIPLFNGNLECRLYGFRMVSGSNR